MKKVLIILATTAVFALALTYDRSYASKEALNVEDVTYRPWDASRPNSKNDSVSNVEQINVDDVISLQVGNVLGLELPEGSKIFQQNDVKGKAVIIKLVGWLNTAKVSKAAVGEKQFAKHGYPMVINIKMSEGKVVHIESAFSCILETNEDGSGLKTCSDIKGEIVLGKDKDSNSIRLISTKLYEWLQGGWKQE